MTRRKCYHSRHRYRSHFNRQLNIYMQAPRDFGLFTNQPQSTASVCQAEELLETEQKSRNAEKEIFFGRQL